MLYMFGLNFKIKSAILFNIINLSFFLKKKQQLKNKAVSRIKMTNSQITFEGTE